MMHTWGAPYGAGMYGPGIASIFIWVAIIAGIVFLVYYLKTNNAGLVPIQAKAPEEKISEAVEILRERFARGEIEKDEYEEKIKILRNT